jgi:hypothetical protein
MNLISSPKRKLGINSLVLRFKDHKEKEFYHELHYLVTPSNVRLHEFFIYIREIRLFV